MTDRGVLGRGLRSLIPQVNKKMNKVNIMEIPISQIQANKNQPRVIFDQIQLDKLAHSIEQKGVLQPILLRKVSTKNQQSFYEIIAGERRYRASSQVGLEKIPAIIKDVSSEESYEIALIENLQRKDLNWIEKAESYRRCMKLFHMTQEQFALKIGISRSSVTNTLRLLNLPKDIQKHIKEGNISFSQAKSLMSISSDQKKRKIIDFFVEKKITSIKFDQYVNQEKNTKTKSGSRIDKKKILSKKEDQKLNLGTQRDQTDVSFLENKLESLLNLSVKILDGKEKKMVIHYEFLDQLKSLVERLSHKSIPFEK